MPDIGLKQLPSTIVEHRRAFPAVPIDLKLAYPSRQYVNAKIKTFVEFLTVSLREKLALQVADRLLASVYARNRLA